MIEYFKRTIKDRELKKINRFSKGCWVSAINPNEEELNMLEEKFGLEKQNLLSGLDENEIPRVEFDKDKTYVILKTMSNGNITTILITITKDFVLTLSSNKPNFLDIIRENKVRFITTQKKKCLLNLLSFINKYFERETMDIVKKVNIQKRKVKNLPEKEMGELLFYEDRLNELVSSYYHINMVYRRLVKKLNFYEGDEKDIEDLIIEIEEGFNLCKSSLKKITNIRNNLMIVMSNRLNKIITLLTIVTVFISIPAAISGVYGMNIVLPIQNNPNAFFYIIFLNTIIWILFLVYFKIKKII